MCIATNLIYIDQIIAQQKGNYVLVIHGGAGTIVKGNITSQKEAEYKAGLQKALEAGYKVIQSGRSSVDAVEAAICVLEDDPHFNAGKGAVFTHDGRNELDASIMNGNTLNAGAVAGVHTIRNPISAAKAVMERSEHVMLCGAGAEQFAKEAGLKIVDPGYFFTEDRWNGLQKALKEDSIKKEKQKRNADNAVPADKISGAMMAKNEKLGITNVDNKFGTVGCVALDKQGNLAAGTSTGGMTDKKYGRIGDSPIIGAGTYANNKTVAVSCTGWGEFYIRCVVAYDLSALMEYKDMSVNDAAKTVLDKLAKLGGNGGLIALDKNGNMTMPFNTEGMFRGAVTKDGKIEIYMYK